MKIAIVGATRGIGFELVNLALADGHQVTILARNPGRMKVSHPNLSIIVGNAEDASSIAKLIERQDVICNCIGTKNIIKHITMFSKSAENIAKAIRPEQLLIAVTGLGAGDSKGHCGFFYDKIFLPLVLKRVYADKDRQEAIIRNEISRWIIVRPGFLNNGPQTGYYRALTNLTDVHGGSISRADVADFILQQAKWPRFIGQTPMLIY